MKFIISIDGRICSGKSTIIKLLQQKLKEIYNLDVPCFSCGQHYRTNFHNKIPKEQVDDEMIKFTRSVYTDNDIAIIDGRSVSFAIKSGDILVSDKPLISILIDVDKDVQLSRLIQRMESNHPEPFQYAIERDNRDERRCFARYKRNIFDKQYYDLHINTSHISVEDAANVIVDALAHNGNTKKKTLLYAEETDTPLGRKLLNRNDINVVFLRFSQHYHFSEQYIMDTYAKNVFTVADLNPDEILRFHNWSATNGINPDCFYNGSEFLQEKANIFARNLGLSALNDEQILWTRDKVEMKKKLKSSGIAVTDFTPIENIDDIIHFASVYNYPIIFKRRTGQSCMDTYKLSNVAEIQSLPLEIVPNKFMVEKFNDGKEWIIDGLIQDGKVLDTFITYVPNSPLSAMTDNLVRGHIACNNVPNNFNFKPNDFIQRIVTSMNLRNGYIHSECFVDQNGMPTLGEFGWRPAGHRIIENHAVASGIDIYDAIIDIATGKPVELKKHQSDKVIGNVFLPRKSGQITEMQSKEEILAEKGVFDVELLAKIGEEHDVQRKSSETSGYAFVQGKNIPDVENKMQQVFRNFYNKIKTK